MGNFLRLVNGWPRMVAETPLPTIYDQTDIIGSTITAGTAYTLPASGNYVGDELDIFWNNVPLDSGTDFNFVGTGTKTQVSFTFNLLATDKLRFRKLRGP